MSDSADLHVLACHPARPAPSVRADAGIALSDKRIVFRYRLRGDMARVRVRVRVPPTLVAERRDFLWKHTCFEAFAGVEGNAAYREFNFSPSGQWAAYDFGDYRRRLADPALPAPRMSLRLEEERLELEAVLPLSSLPFAAGGAAWEIALAAVVETEDGIGHFALRHVAPIPDFHRRESFVLRHSEN